MIIDSGSCSSSRSIFNSMLYLPWHIHGRQVNPADANTTQNRKFDWPKIPKAEAGTVRIVKALPARPGLLSGPAPFGQPEAAVAAPRINMTAALRSPAPTAGRAAEARGPEGAA